MLLDAPEHQADLDFFEAHPDEIFLVRGKIPADGFDAWPGVQHIVLCCLDIPKARGCDRSNPSIIVLPFAGGAPPPSTTASAGELAFREALRQQPEFKNTPWIQAFADAWRVSGRRPKRMGGVHA